MIHINKLTDLLLKELIVETDKYTISGSDIELISTASALHDIGKIGIADEILNKPGRLTDEEFEIMKTHTIIGSKMLDDLEAFKGEKLLKTAWQICRWHHERYDGKGTMRCEYGPADNILEKTHHNWYLFEKEINNMKGRFVLVNGG